MAITRRISVERNRLRFAAAHMATFGGDCEPLHGHNYDVTVEIEGELTDESWVWDFGDVKRVTRAIIDELDHRFLLQARSPILHIKQSTGSWTISFQERTYTFPESDVVALPIENTTAERLAEWLAGRLLADFATREGHSFRKLSVGIEEMPGQAGWYTVDL